MLIAFGLPFLFYGMVKIMQGVTQTRSELQDSTTSVQQSLAEQTGSVQNVVDSQEKLIERIQHLEAIVTSEAWDAMAQEKQERIAEHLLQPEEPEEESDEDRAARLARSLDR